MFIHFVSFSQWKRERENGKRKKEKELQKQKQRRNDIHSNFDECIMEFSDEKEISYEWNNDIFDTYIKYVEEKLMIFHWINVLRWIIDVNCDEGFWKIEKGFCYCDAKKRQNEKKEKKNWFLLFENDIKMCYFHQKNFKIVFFCEKEILIITLCWVIWKWNIEKKNNICIKK